MLLPGNCRNFNSYSTQPLFSDQLLIFIFQVKRSISWLTPLIAWAIVKIGTVSGQSFYLNFSPFMVGNPEKLYIENLIYYCISLKNVQGHQLNQQFQKYKNLNNVPFLCTKLFQKRGHLLKKYSTYNFFNVSNEQHIIIASACSLHCEIIDIA